MNKVLLIFFAIYLFSFNSIGYCQSSKSSQGRVYTKDAALVFNINEDEPHTRGHFDENDAKKLQPFFMKRAEEYECNAQELSLVYEVNASVSSQKRQNMVSELEHIGYAVLDLVCDDRKIVFSISRKKQTSEYVNKDLSQPERIALKDVIIQKTEPKSFGITADCSDCGLVKIKDDVLKRFENADYGGAVVIDFDTEVSQTSVPTVQNTTTTDCNDCGLVKIKGDVLKRFENADYGGAVVIDFDTEVSQTSVPTVQNTATTDCSDCGLVKIKGDVLKRFENADYGGDIFIDFEAPQIMKPNH